MFLFGAPGGGTSLWGSGGLGLTCTDATYDNDNFDSLAHTQGLFTLSAQITDAGGLLLVPDASAAFAQRNARHTSFLSGTLDYVFQVQANILADGNTGNAGVGLFSLYTGAGVEIIGPDIEFLNPLTAIRIDWNGAGLTENYPIVFGVPLIFTLKVARVSGVVSFYKDGVLKHSFANTDNTEPRLHCFTGENGGGNLGRVRWDNWQFAKC